MDTPAASPKKTRTLRRVLFCLGLFLFLALLGAAGLCARFLTLPAHLPEKTVEFEVAGGETFDGVARRLVQEGLVRDGRLFRLYGRARQAQTRIQAGVFALSTAMTPPQVLDTLLYGRPVLYPFTVPDGQPWWKTAAQAEAAGFARADDLKALWHDPAYLASRGIPFESAEGFLFPETYLLKKPKTMDEAAAKALSDEMLATFWKKTAPLWTQSGFARRPGERSWQAALLDNATRDEFRRRLILASIVEKETGAPEERARVAGVYANRLRLGMALQADPTVIYGLGPEFAGPLRSRDLENTANPYNTYQLSGLPPGPICSPGAAAVAAALAPEEHRYLYFVATGRDGRHRFSATLAEHNRAVEEYRRVMREKRRKAAAH